MAAGTWKTNADLILDVRDLGYLPGHVCDSTWGRGRWWTYWTPDEFTKHDLFTLDGVDFRHLPEADETFDTVAYDPPYKLNGTPALGDFDNAYGVDVPDTWQGRMECMADGLRECARVLKMGGFLIAKCMDMVSSGAVRWQTDAFSEIAHLELSLEKVDSFNFPNYRAQPEGRKQVHARRNFSTLQVFRKGR